MRRAAKRRKWCRHADQRFRAVDDDGRHRDKVKSAVFSDPVAGKFRIAERFRQFFQTVDAAGADGQAGSRGKVFVIRQLPEQGFGSGGGGRQHHAAAVGFRGHRKIRILHCHVQTEHMQLQTRAAGFPFDCRESFEHFGRPRRAVAFCGGFPAVENVKQINCFPFVETGGIDQRHDLPGDGFADGGVLCGGYFQMDQRPRLFLPPFFNDGNCFFYQFGSAVAFA